MRINNIGDIEITRLRPFLILEAGVNHEGSLDTAFEMIDAAAAAGADMIKFQSYKAETLASRNSPAYWDQTKEPETSQYELFKKHDTFGDDDYRKLACRCRQKDILFCSTPFDSHFVDFLDEFMLVYKVASADITNFLLLKQIASKKKPVLLSVGASYIEEVEQTVQLLQNHGVEQIALLHCILEYPSLAEHANLKVIGSLRSAFPDLTIGWSDHIAPAHNTVSLLAAWMEGADILEKHYTLDKTLTGNDHYHAMDPDDVRTFLKTQRYVAAMIGSGKKTVLECEQIPRKYARRSLVAACDIPAETVITLDMITAKRPGTGISPVHAEEIIGCKAAVDIIEDDLLQWEMILR